MITFDASSTRPEKRFGDSRKYRIKHTEHLYRGAVRFCLQRIYWCRDFKFLTIWPLLEIDNYNRGVELCVQ